MTECKIGQTKIHPRFLSVHRSSPMLGKLRNADGQFSDFRDIPDCRRWSATVEKPCGKMSAPAKQERDISNVSSTRRNPILADIFGRLGYMERQGSGFKKITESYYAAHNYRDELEPKFYSDASSFQVTLYNLNYGMDEKVVVGEEKVALEAKKVAFERSISESKLKAYQR